MDTKITIHLLLLALILLGCAVMPLKEEPQGEQPQSAPEAGTITLLEENGNRILLETDSDNHALIQIFSEQGRGSTDISIPNATYPATIKMRLHLRGLEELIIRHRDSTRDSTHLLSLSSIADTDGTNSIRQSIIDTTGERALTPAGPEWLAVELAVPQAQAASTQPTIPLEDGHIDITLPPSFTTQQVRQFTVQWVDFYR